MHFPEGYVYSLLKLETYFKMEHDDDKICAGVENE